MLNWAMIKWFMSLNTPAKQLMAGMVLVIAVQFGLNSHLYYEVISERADKEKAIAEKDTIIFHLIADKENLLGQVSTAKEDAGREILALFKGLLADSKEEIEKQKRINAELNQAAKNDREYMREVSKQSLELNKK